MSEKTKSKQRKALCKHHHHHGANASSFTNTYVVGSNNNITPNTFIPPPPQAPKDIPVFARKRYALYIRHSTVDDKADRNEDAALTTPGTQRARQAAIELVKQYGVLPSAIVASPYRRALETALLMVDVLATQFQCLRTVITDPTLARKSHTGAITTASTSVEQPPMDETSHEFTDRCLHHATHVAQPGVWYITHSSFLSTLRQKSSTVKRKLGHASHNHIPSCGHIVVQVPEANQTKQQQQQQSSSSEQSLLIV